MKREKKEVQLRKGQQYGGEGGRGRGGGCRRDKAWRRSKEKGRACLEAAERKRGTNKGGEKRKNGGGCG